MKNGIPVIINGKLNIRVVAAAKSKFRSMKIIRLDILVIIVSVWVVLSYSSSCGGSLYSDEQKLAYYDYDRRIPLDPSEELVDAGENRDIYEIVFSTITGEPVTGRLYLPSSMETGTTVPVIIYLHSYWGDRTELDKYCLYIMGFFDRETKYAVFALDAMHRGERAEWGKDIVTLNPVETRDAIARTVIDYRRGIDYLETRDDIDSGEVHLLGTSMGAFISGILGAVDDRIGAVALIAGGGGWCDLVSSSFFPEMLQMKAAFAGHCSSMERYWDLVDPIEFIHILSPRPLQMHSGVFDIIMPTGWELFNEAGEPKEVYWYFASHYSMVLFLAPIRNRVLDFFDAN